MYVVLFIWRQKQEDCFCQAVKASLGEIVRHRREEEGGEEEREGIGEERRREDGEGGRRRAWMNRHSKDGQALK